MTKNCNVVIKRTVLEPLNACPFPENIGIRELARQTGFDAAWLSRVKRGIIPITQETLERIESKLARVAA